eukprot:1609482-Pleurochrysis_carterae.AAC.1
MATAASVALRRLASEPDSQNAARIRRIGGGMPSGTLGHFYMLVVTCATFIIPADICCLAYRSAQAHEGQGSVHQRAGAQ